MDKFRSFFGRIAPLLGFKGSESYWEKRYRMGGNSGEGSRGANATYKADALNRFVREHDIASAIEFGCGDGYQLGLMKVSEYTGVDVSTTIIDQCRRMYSNDAGKRFILLHEYRDEKAHVALSLDVIFHLVEDAVYDDYLARLFSAAEKYVIVYSTSAKMSPAGRPHVRHRDCATDIAARFPNFSRMHEAEAAVSPPVRFAREIPTRFFFYRRES